MKPELKAKWVAALRSGEYQQGRGFLCRDGAYCCWGVLRQVADPNDTRDACNGRVVSEAQLGEWGFASRYQTNVLENMNDGSAIIAPKSFTEIADYIEANL